MLQLVAPTMLCRWTLIIWRNIFSDEAHFWLNGHVKKQSFLSGGKKIPAHVKSLYPIKITVWTAMSFKGIHIEFIDEWLVKFIKIF